MALKLGAVVVGINVKADDAAVSLKNHTLPLQNLSFIEKINMQLQILTANVDMQNPHCGLNIVHPYLFLLT